MKVDFVTLGGAAERLEVPPPTLRSWTDQLEELDTHHTKRNNRNERIYEQGDIEIFAFLRDLKSEYGRKTTTKDLAAILEDDGRFSLRSKEDAPSPVQDPSNRTELLNQEDIKELMSSDRVQQFMKIVIDQTTKNIKEDLTREVTENVVNELRSEFEDSRILQERTISAVNEGYDKVVDRMKNIEEKENRGFWSKLFG